MTHYKDRATRSERLNRETERLIERFSPANRDFIKESVRHRRNKGLKPGSVRMYANCMFHADQVLKKPFREATPDDLANLIATLRLTKSERYVATISVLLRAGWKELLDVDKLPKPIFRALEVREPRNIVTGYVIPDEDFQAMLAIAADQDGETSILHRSPMLVALLWVLRSTGFRISEALSLNIGDVRLDEQGAYYALRPDAPDLKTGPRTVYDVRSVPAVKAWLALHPLAGDATASVFIGLRDHTGRRRLSYLTVGRLLTKLAVASGAQAKVPTGQNITPHDLRHTRWTEYARNREGSEEQMRVLAGWSPGSKMPSIYIHLSLADQKESVIRASGMTTTGNPLPGMNLGIGPEELKLLQGLKKLLSPS